VIRSILITKAQENQGVLADYCKTHNIEIVYHSFLSFSPIELKKFPTSEVLFFSSKRAVDYFLKQSEISENTAVACIGESTKIHLNSKGILVDFVGENAGKPETISKKFAHWLGERTCTILLAKESKKTILKHLNQSKTECCTVYETHIHTRKIEQEFDYIAFTSPSNVEGYLKENEIPNTTHVIAWGETTKQCLLENGVTCTYTLLHANESEIVDKLKLKNTMLTIQNSTFKISVTKIGAELCSLFSKKDNIEFMWQANPTIWGSHAPVLFPIIGCLKDGEFLFEEKRFSVQKHGFIRNNETLESNIIGENYIEFHSKYNEETLKNYPFKYEFILRYLLQENGVKLEHTIINHDENNPLYFSLGGHPGFNCPFFENESYEDYYIEFEVPETDTTWLVNNEGLIENESISYLKETKILPLHPEIFAKDALIFKNLKSKTIALKSKNHSVALKMDISEFEYLGLWAKPNAPFICIEPWLGISDSINTKQDFTQKEGIQRLEARKTQVISFEIKIEG
jgi:galactose mutarotase-like enzyme/uroporphyrinogen-III synthase